MLANRIGSAYVRERLTLIACDTSQIQFLSASCNLHRRFDGFFSSAADTFWASTSQWTRTAGELCRQ